MKQNILNLDGVKQLNKLAQKQINGGKLDGKFRCICNGHYVGDAETSTGCAQLCADCTSCGNSFI